jgi:hypothetical protein
MQAPRNMLPQRITVRVKASSKRCPSKLSFRETSCARKEGAARRRPPRGESRSAPEQSPWLFGLAALAAPVLFLADWLRKLRKR